MKKRKVPVLPDDVSERMIQIGNKVNSLRQDLDSNYKNFAEKHGINNMTLWRIQNAEDYKMSNFLIVLREIGITPEKFFQGIK